MSEIPIPLGKGLHPERICPCGSCSLRRENEKLRNGLEQIDAFLTTAKGDNIPAGEACKRHARAIARIALGKGV